MCFDLGFYLSGWGDLNSRPSVPQTDALTKLRHSPRLSDNTGLCRSSHLLSRYPGQSGT